MFAALITREIYKRVYSKKFLHKKILHKTFVLTARRSLLNLSQERCYLKRLSLRI